MNRTFASVVFAAVLASTSFAATAQAQQTPEKLTKRQLQSLIATAKTPAEHTRIAQYYQAKAQDGLAQSKMHEEMAAQYKANPLASSSKFATGTVNHCEYLAQHLKENAAQMQKLAQEHEQMALDAAGK